MTHSFCHGCWTLSIAVCVFANSLGLGQRDCCAAPAEKTLRLRLDAHTAEKVASHIATIKAAEYVKLNAEVYGEEGAEALERILKECPSLVHLDITARELDFERLTPHAKNIVTLRVKYVGPPSVHKNLSALARWPRLRELSLKHYALSANEMEVLGSLKQLRVIGLEYSFFGSLAPLAKIPNLEVLVLWFCENSSDTQSLVGLKKLRSLAIWDGAVKDLSPLAEMKTLEELTLARCYTRDLSPLTKLPALKHLDLGESAFSDSSPIETMTRLEHLNVSEWHSLTSPPDLRKLRNLESFCGLGCTSLEDLSGLDESHNLRKLNLKYCRKLKTLAALSKLKKLEELNLSECESLEDLSGLEESHKLRQLNLERCSKLKSLAALSNLKNLKNLKNLNLCGCEEITDISPLSNHVGMLRLDLTGCNVRDLTPLENFAALEVLRLSGNDIEDLTPLAGAVNLRELDATSCGGLKSMAGLSRLSKLESLNLQGCKLVTDVTPLASHRELKTLDLSGCGKLDLSPLAKLDNLEILALDGSEVDDIAPLVELRRLKWLKLKQCRRITALPDMSGMEGLGSISLKGCSKLSDASRAGRSDPSGWNRFE
jgi:Leucine-rich repeat (LRR) protein